MENYQDVNFEIEEELPDHHFRTEIPNILFDIGLEPLVFATYCYLKRIAGDKGKSWQSNRKIADSIGISKRKLIDIIEILQTPHPVLKISLIKVQHRKKPDGSPDTNLITMVNLWGLNGKHFRYNNLSKNEGGSAGDALGGARYAPGGALNAHKEEPFQEDLSKKQQQHIANPQEKVVVVPSALDKLELSDDLKSKLLKEFSIPEIDIAVQRCLNWKGRESDSAAIVTALRNASSWQDITKSEDRPFLNKEIAQKLKECVYDPGDGNIEILNEHVEISHRSGYAVCISYKENGFKDQLESAMRKYNIRWKTK